MQRILALATVTASAVAPGMATGQATEFGVPQATEVAQPPNAMGPSAPIAASETDFGVEGASDRRDPTKLALARALDERMTVWRSPHGRRVYVRSCRQAPGIQGGCRARIVALVQLLVDVGRERGVDPFLLAAMALRESGLNPYALGGAGERGIVQLHPRGVGSRVRFVRSESYRRSCRRRADSCQREVVDAGARLLARAMHSCDSVVEALGAYNGGECRETEYGHRVLEERAGLVRLAKASPLETAHLVD